MTEAGHKAEFLLTDIWKKNNRETLIVSLGWGKPVSLSGSEATSDLLGLHLYQTLRCLLLPGHWSVPNTRLLTRT